MSKRFIQLTSGWIPVAVLLLLAAALVSGARGDDLAGDVPAAPGVSFKGFGTAPGERAKTVRLTLRSVVDMPSEISFDLDATIVLPDVESEVVRYRNLPGAGQ